MIGKSVTDFVHKADHPELVKQFTKANTSTEGRLALTEHEGNLTIMNENNLREIIINVMLYVQYFIDLKLTSLISGRLGIFFHFDLNIYKLKTMFPSIFLSD